MKKKPIKAGPKPNSNANTKVCLLIIKHYDVFQCLYEGKFLVSSRQAIALVEIDNRSVSIASFMWPDHFLLFVIG